MPDSFITTLTHRVFEDVLRAQQVHLHEVLGGILSVNPHQIFAEELLKTLARDREQIQSDLWQKGWMIDLETPHYSMAAIMAKSPSDVDSAMVDYVNRNLDQSRSKLLEAFPKRRKALESAFQAYTRGDYTASIPLMMAQADGITKDFLNLSAYNKNQIKVALQRKQLDSFDYSMLKVMGELNSLNANERERQNARFESALNRHLIQHGEVSDYGNEVNGAKTLAFLTFVGLVMANAVKLKPR